MLLGFVKAKVHEELAVASDNDSSQDGLFGDYFEQSIILTLYCLWLSVCNSIWHKSTIDRKVVWIRWKFHYRFRGRKIVEGLHVTQNRARLV